MTSDKHSPPGPGMRITNAIELFDLWTTMMGAGGFGRRSVWLVFFDRDARLLQLVVPIEDVPMEPNEEVLAGIRSAVGGLVDSGDVASVAMLLSRPGPGSFSSADRRWAHALSQAFGSLSPWPVHLATRDRVQVFAADDLIAS